MFLHYSLGCLGWTHRKLSFTEGGVSLGEATAGGGSPSLGVNEDKPNEVTVIPTQRWQQSCCKQSLPKGVPGLPPLPLRAASLPPPCQAQPAQQEPGGRWDTGEQRPSLHGRAPGRALLRAQASAAAAGPRPACPRQVAAAAAAPPPARGPVRPLQGHGTPGSVGKARPQVAR